MLRAKLAEKRDHDLPDPLALVGVGAAEAAEQGFEHALVVPLGERAEVDDVTFVGGCTACGPDAFSHRARQDTGRQAVLVWIEDAA